MWNGPSTVLSVASAASLMVSTSIETPRTSESSTNSCRVSSHFRPTAVRNSIAVSHSGGFDVADEVVQVAHQGRQDGLGSALGVPWRDSDDLVGERLARRLRRMGRSHTVAVLEMDDVGCLGEVVADRLTEQLRRCVDDAKTSVWSSTESQPTRNR